MSDKENKATFYVPHALASPRPAPMPPRRVPLSRHRTPARQAAWLATRHARSALRWAARAGRAAACHGHVGPGRGEVVMSSHTPACVDTLPACWVLRSRRRSHRHARQRSINDLGAGSAMTTAPVERTGSVSRSVYATSAIPSVPCSRETHHHGLPLSDPSAPVSTGQRPTCSV
jgi:hypothetical protein